MVVCVHVTLALPLKLKLWGNLYWYLNVYGFVSIFDCLQKIQDYIMEKEEV
jgi:hypothetical protein